MIAYASENGTIGVYLNLERLWRVKSKSIATCQTVFGKESLLTGWKNGRWEMRGVKNGEILFKSQMKSSISSILIGPFSLEDNTILVSDTSGVIQLFTAPSVVQSEKRNVQVKNDTLRKIENKKETLNLELDVLQKNQPKHLSIDECITKGIIPRSAKLTCTLKHSFEGLCIELNLTDPG